MNDALRNLKPLPGLPHLKAKLIRPDRCEKCKFSATMQGRQELECHEGPPTATTFMVPGRNGQAGYVTHTGFPIVNGDCWCGRFGPKVEGVN